jgi:protein-S-isoprenylcysteine O-methyltransferase Ste14
MSMLQVTAIVSAGTGVLLSVWAAFYFGFARSIDVEEVRKRMIERIQEQHSQLGVKELIDVIYDTDFRLLQKKEKNTYFFVSFCLVVVISVFLFLLSLTQGSIFVDENFGETIKIIFDILVLLYCLFLIFAIFFLYFEVMYYIKFDEHERALPSSGPGAASR